MSTSPISPTVHQDVQRSDNNTHPYAIKSSSSGLLSRSNSMSNPVLSHHYVPLPLSRVKRRYVPSKKLGKIKRDDKRLTPDEDPDATSASPVSVRVRRRDSLPPSFSESKKTEFEDGLEELSVNPKQWTPFQLATYLSSMLRLPGGDLVPSPVMRKIAAFILKHHLNGRAFLKMTRDDYNAYDIDPLWKESLIIASVTLRQSLVQRQIFGSIKAASISNEDLFSLRNPDEDHTTNAPIALPTTPGAYIPWNKKRTLGRLEAGRVKGIAYKYERSNSTGESDYDPSERRLGGFLEKGESESDSDVSFVESPSLENNESHRVMHEIGSPLLQDAGSIPDEVTVQELILAQSPSSYVWGAKAWEEENLINVTAKKITQEQGNAEDILAERTDKNTHSHTKTLASLFSEPEINIPRTDLTEQSGEILETNSHASEDVRPGNEISPSSEADILPAIMKSTSSVDSQESLFTSLWYQSESPSTSPRSSVIVTESFHRTAKAPKADLIKEDESLGSLREALRIVQERLIVVEERLLDLEQRETEQRHGVQKPSVEERTTEVTAKTNISSPKRSVSSEAIAQVCEHDVVNEDLYRLKSCNNYVLSDMNLYSCLFYASVGLAALVIDKTIFGRRKF